MPKVYDLLPGDVILFRLSKAARWWQAPLARLIRLIQGNTIVHVETVMYHLHGTGHVVVASAEPFRGTYLRTWNGEATGLLEPVGVYRPTWRDALTKPALEAPAGLLDRGYGWAGIFNLALNHLLRLHRYRVFFRGKGLHCSQMAAEILRHHGGLAPSVDGLLVEPDDFTISVLFGGRILR